MKLSMPRFDQAQVLVVGDVMLADGPGQLIAAGGDPLAPFARVLVVTPEGRRALSSSDQMAIV